MEPGAAWENTVNLKGPKGKARALAAALLSVLWALCPPTFGDPTSTQSLRDDQAAAWADFQKGEYEPIQGTAIEFQQFEKTGQEVYFSTTLYKNLSNPNNLSQLLEWTQQNDGSDVAWTALGLCYIHVAWNFRGNGPVTSVPPSALQPFHENLAEARTCLEKAAQLNPDNPYPLAYQIEIDKGLGAPETVMEEHFQKAIQVDPNCLPAYWLKGSFLSPRWYGSWNQLKDFYMKAGKTAPQHSPVRLLVRDYHTEYGLSLPNEAQRVEYWSEPEVWNDMKTAYGDFLEDHPDYQTIRCEFARYAVMVGDREAAEAQFKILKKLKSPDWKTAGWASLEAYQKARDQF